MLFTFHDSKVLVSSVYALVQRPSISQSETYKARILQVFQCIKYHSLLNELSSMYGQEKRGEEASTDL